MIALDAGWGQFTAILVSKAESAGRELVKVNPAGTSQACSACGAVVPKTLAQRTHRCPGCGYTASRDMNAAINVLLKGLGPSPRGGAAIRHPRDPRSPPSAGGVVTRNLRFQSPLGGAADVSRSTMGRGARSALPVGPWFRPELLHAGGRQDILEGAAEPGKDVLTVEVATQLGVLHVGERAVRGRTTLGGVDHPNEADSRGQILTDGISDRSGALSGG